MLSLTARLIRLSLLPVTLALLSIACAAVAALAAVSDSLNATLFCQTAQGANIDNALGVVFFGCLPLALLTLLARRLAPSRAIFLATALLLDAGALALAIAFVALDAATYLGDNCTLGGPSAPSHVDYLYIAWGVPLAVLLIQVGRVLRSSPADG